MYRQKREQTYFTVTGVYSYDKTLFDNLNLPNSLDKDTAVTEILMTCGLLELAYPDGDVLKNIINVWSFARKPDWQRMLDALYATYNPIHNYDRTEDSTGSGTSTGQKGIQSTGQFAETEHVDDINERVEDITETRTDNLTDTRTPNITNQRTDNLTETKNGGETTTHQNTAYNAGLTDTSKDILVRNGDTTANTGTQTTVESGQEATAHTGTQENATEGSIVDDRDIDRSKSGSNSNTETMNEMGTQSNTGHLYARGNIGVTSTQNLIEQEISIRYKFNIYEIIAREFKEKFCNLTDRKSVV